jgi:hypothetical protein
VVLPSATATTGTTILATFNGLSAAEVTQVIVRENTVAVAGQASLGNLTQTLKVTRSFAAGQVLTPKLVSMSKLTPVSVTDAFTGVTTTTYLATLTFDQKVAIKATSATTGTLVTLNTLTVLGAPGTAVTGMAVAPAHTSAGYSNTVTLEFAATALPALAAAAAFGVGGSVTSGNGAYTITVASATVPGWVIPS